MWTHFPLSCPGGLLSAVSIVEMVQRTIVALSIPSLVTDDFGAYTCTASVSDLSGSRYVVDG